MTVTLSDRHIRLQKEHPARGWGHMVLPSAGVALDQVTTLVQGHDCLRFVPSASPMYRNNAGGGGYCTIDRLRRSFKSCSICVRP